MRSRTINYSWTEHSQSQDLRVLILDENKSLIHCPHGVTKSEPKKRVQGPGVCTDSMHTDPLFLVSQFRYQPGSYTLPSIPKNSSVNKDTLERNTSKHCNRICLWICQLGARRLKNSLKSQFQQLPHHVGHLPRDTSSPLYLPGTHRTTQMPMAGRGEILQPGQHHNCS